MKVYFKNSDLIFQKSAREDFVFTNHSAIDTNGSFQSNVNIPAKATEGYTEINDWNKNKTVINAHRNSPWAIAGVAMYNSSKTFLGYYNPSGDNVLTFNVAISDLLTLQPTTKYIRVSAELNGADCFIGIPEE